MYKVVSYYNNIYYSASSFKIKYIFNKWVFPEYGKLFVFDTLENATEYISPTKNLKIFKCDILGEPEKPEKICDWSLTTQEQRDYWNGKTVSTMKPHLGTILVDAVKLIGEPL